jgi:hypothetical protein
MSKTFRCQPIYAPKTRCVVFITVGDKETCKGGKIDARHYFKRLKSKQNRQHGAKELNDQFSDYLLSEWQEEADWDMEEEADWSWFDFDYAAYELSGAK